MHLDDGIRVQFKPSTSKDTETFSRLINVIHRGQSVQKKKKRKRKEKTSSPVE